MNKELKALEITSLYAERSFNQALVSSWNFGMNVSRFNRHKDSSHLKEYRLKLDVANKAYVLAKQSLREVKL